jgi:hypothetical protein
MSDEEIDDYLLFFIVIGLQSSGYFRIISVIANEAGCEIRYSSSYKSE